MLMYTFFEHGYIGAKARIPDQRRKPMQDIEDIQTATKTEVCPNGHCNYNFCSHKTHLCLTTLHCVKIRPKFSAKKWFAQAVNVFLQAYPLFCKHR